MFARCVGGEGTDGLREMGGGAWNIGNGMESCDGLGSCRQFYGSK